MINALRKQMLQFLGIDRDFIKDPKQEDFIERYIQRLEKENEILKLEMAELRKPKAKNPENFKPIRRFVSWNEQRLELERIDRENKRKKDNEEANSK